jgi:hypothetical protein
MEPTGIDPHEGPHPVRHRKHRLPLADGDHRLARGVGEEFVKPPHAREGEGIAAAHPLPLEHLERGRGADPVPVVGDVEQIAAGRTGGEDLVDAVGRPTGRGDALLENEIGAGGDGQGTLLRFLSSVGRGSAVAVGSFSGSPPR